MYYSYLRLPLLDDLEPFLDDLETRHDQNFIDDATYHMCLGKALGYVECRFSAGLIDRSTAFEYMSRIEAMK